MSIHFCTTVVIYDLKLQLESSVNINEVSNSIFLFSYLYKQYYDICTIKV